MFLFYCTKKQAEARAEFAERSVQKLQKEVDRLEGKFIFLHDTLLQLIIIGLILDNTT